MKVLMLFNDYLEHGGERNSVSAEATALITHGVNVELMTVTNEQLVGAPTTQKVRETFPNRVMRSSIADAIDNFKPDVVHAQNLFPRIGASGIDALRHSNTPWVRTIRNYRKGCIAGTYTRNGVECLECQSVCGRLPGIVHSCYRDSRAQSIGATAYSLWDNLAERRHPPSFYICISDAAHRRIESNLHPSVPVQIVHNAVVNHASVPYTSMCERQFDACYVGRLTHEKGVSLFLEVAKQNSDLKFAIAGTGELRPDVEAAAKSTSNLVDLGLVDNAAALGVMANSRFTLVPSQWDEPFGRVAAEAMSVGSLPLVSDRGGLPEVVSTMEYAAVVGSGGFRRWAGAVSALAATPKPELEKYSVAAMDSWRSRFSAESVSTALISVYERSVLPARKE
ncbi:glycosyltransferase [Rhodococcus sp. SORGH_AS_0303]|uniref:glycosyltransferase n=1 Tax=Rhodococcus sp. SORGH_AS_0303 TaxID=3041753 RepID=UPI00278859E8|nr:glycosyltransferase [Rhodococcus sp. SORGH_AS_0303]MDQ1203315.1 glycosyltransferase involved in cell wall biosynthesis [Rhodococcus sp. SORGH_AS_0303]